MKKYIYYTIGYIILGLLYECIYIEITNNIGTENSFIVLLLYTLLFLPLFLGYFFCKKLKNIYQNENSTFIQSWTLIDFAREFGPKMQVGVFYSISGKPYHKCVFIKPDGTKTYVNFFSQLGELTSQEISKRKEELSVGLNIFNKYYLCDKKVNKCESIDLNLI